MKQPIETINGKKTVHLDEILEYHTVGIDGKLMNLQQKMKLMSFVEALLFIGDSNEVEE